MRPLPLIALFACATLTVSCAGSRPSLPAAPQIQMPAQARAACDLYRLPDAPTRADLEIGYATRGAQVAACDAARKLAVETHDAEHALEAEGRGERADRR